MAIRPLQDGEPVEIYWNLNKDCYSVRVGGYVVAYVDKFTITNVKFAAQKAGRERVRRQNRKNVHAFVRGKWSNTMLPTPTTRITYNPYSDESFVVADTARTPIHTAAYAVGGYRYKEDGTPVASIHAGI